MPPKILGLELLRGLCALLVAIYHCLMLSGTALYPSWGLYGVYIFFVVSGVVLYANYSDRLSLSPRGNEISIGQFLLKRFARLAPLMWACILVPAILRNSWVPDRYFLNLSLLFGFGSPGQTSYLTGGWSIGIEIVLYALFPVLLGFTKSLRAIAATLLLLLVLRVAFVSLMLGATTFGQAWPLYTQPAAFLFFFCAGMGLAQIMPKIHVRAVYLLGIGLLSAIAIFVFPGASYEAVLLGWHGLALTLLSVVIVAGFFWSPSSPTLEGVCKFFGDISYGLYLLHPLAWVATARYFPPMTIAEHTAITLALSIAGAWLSLRFYERPVRTWIVKSAITKLRTRPAATT